MFNANIINGKLGGCSQCKVTSDGLVQIEITEEVFNNIERYEYKDGQIVEISDYDEKQAKEERKLEILAELDALDSKSIRALRAGESKRLEELEAQAVELRKELGEL